MSEFKIPLDIKSLEITSQSIDSFGTIELEVVSKGTSSRCHNCGKAASKRYGTAPEMKVRHLSILDRPVYLKIKPIRYQCEDCNSVTTEQYDWCKRNARVTNGLSDYIARCCIHSTVQDVSRKEELSYKTVNRILEEKIGTCTNWNKIKDLETLGIDEISLKKGWNDYVVVISSKDSTGSVTVLAVLTDRSKEAVLKYLRNIPEDLRKTVKTVCTDMYEGYLNAASAVFGSHKVVIDRYHVAKQYRDCIDRVRIDEMARLKKTLPDNEYKKLKGIIWSLRAKHECLNEDDKEKLELLYVHSPKLKEAHYHAIKLTSIFNTHSNKKDAFAKLSRWSKRVQKYNIKCFATFNKTLTKHKKMISNYFKKRKTSGFVEGLNNKIKVAKRRCYGIANALTLWQRIQLDMTGFKLFSRCSN